MKKVMLVSVMVILAATMLGSAASAFTVGTFYWLDYLNVTGQTGYTKNGTYLSSGLAGAINMNVYNLLGDGSWNASKGGQSTRIATLCLSPNETLNDPFKSQFKSLDVDAKVAWLVEHNELSATDTAFNAGFQLAVWDVMGPDTYLGQGLVSTVGTSEYWRNYLVNSVSSLSGTDSVLGFDGNDGSTDKSQNLTDPAVPEFPAAALAPLGLLAFGMLKRKFAR